MIESIDLEKLCSAESLVSIAYWLTQGDGNIDIPVSCTNGRFQVIHSAEHMDYIKMKATFLSKITSVKYAERYRKGVAKPELQLWTKTHPVFTKLKRRIYLDGRKVLSEHGLKMLPPICLAFLYQDDGTFNPKKSNITISKPMLSALEMQALAKAIVDRYGIIFRVRRSCTLKDGSIGHELGLRYSDRDKFFSLIEPYIVPSMRYKITTGGSSK